MLSCTLTDPVHPIVLPSAPLYWLLAAYKVYVVLLELLLALTWLSLWNKIVHHPLLKKGKYIFSDWIVPPSLSEPDKKNDKFPYS